MTSRFRLLAASVASTALLLSACGSTPSTSLDALTATSTDTSTETVDEMAVLDAPSAVLASKATRPDGTTFSLSDFAGKTVFVETFATWCSTCRKQLVDTDAAAAQAASDDVIFLVLSIETDIDPANLQTYANENNFSHVEFALLDAAGLIALRDQFGRSVLNAPSTPKFLISPDGSLSEMTTGLESADEILAQLA